MTEQLPIIIAGAGIGGLSAALALAHKNIPVLLLERNRVPTEVGAGVQISPNATASLRDWGVWPYLSEHAVTPPQINIFSGFSGRPLSSLDTRDFESRYGSPYFVVHRADLHQALYHRASQLDLIEILEDREVREIAQTDDYIEVRSKRDNGTQRFYRGSALIAADGVWSRVRTEHVGSSPATYSGKTAWRITMPMQMVPKHFDSQNVGLWLSPKAHLVHYPVVGGHMLNIVAIVDENWTEEGWSAPGDAAWLNKRFSRWPLEIRELLAEREGWLKWALCGHKPDQHWVKGKVALLGDAAHGMLPFMAQGAGMAIEDAAILARAIDEISASMHIRLMAYERARKARVSQVVNRAAKNGDIYHFSGPLATARNMTMRLMPRTQLLKKFDWIYSWRPDQVQFDI
ncbi:FAD-dependent monooxygenase [uncultured Cohaesibacter sp.]|uniref:FAD-dependent monooxygenase n=1 Tax=uncultured Cohaesibacter sp. TaxID=1002546 RepID=UPI0029C6C439|nr:FAD-dependent monooxygenase [uncultured Cohaesibacter sp.]